MIHFFRSIRKRLLSENRLTRYLIYAIGEIALVMIGILLALQVNNWNENRKQDNLEKNYLRALIEEFKDNLKEVDRVITLNEKNLSNAKALSQLTGPGRATITDGEFSKLIFGTLINEVQYRPGSGVINEIIGSGKLTIFSNPLLKKSIASMDGLLLKIRFQETEEHGTSRKELFSLLQGKDIGMRKLSFDAHGELFGVDAGRFTERNVHILQNKQFENHLVGFIYTAGFLGKNYYPKLKEEIENVIALINDQLEK